MSNSTALTTRQAPTTNAPTSLADIRQYAQIFHASKMFKDIEGEAAAAVKILAGAELGIPPFAAMGGIHIIKGKATLSATLMATLIKRSGRYNYRVTKHTATECEIAFFEQGEPCGVTSFTHAEAKTAGLLGNDTWTKYPKAMLFARTLSQGARYFCPDIFGGPMYTPEELGAAVDEEGNVLQAPLTLIQATEAPTEPAQATETAETPIEDIEVNRLRDRARTVKARWNDDPATGPDAWKTIFGERIAPGKWSQLGHRDLNKIEKFLDTPTDLLPINAEVVDEMKSAATLGAIAR